MTFKTVGAFAGRLGSAVLLSLVAAAAAYPQAEMHTPGTTMSQMFFVESLCYRGSNPQTSSLEFFIQIPYERLSFVRSGNAYNASFETILSVYDENQKLLSEKSWMEDLTVNDFAQTSSTTAYRLSQRTLDIAPGNYRIAIQVRDKETGRGTTIWRNVKVTDYSKDSLGLSDIMLVNRLSKAGEKTNVVPNITGYFTDLSNGFFLFAEIYNATALDSIRLRWRIYNQKREPVYADSRMEALTLPRQQAFIRIGTVALTAGLYYLTIEAVAPDSADSASSFSITERTFSVRHPNLPPTITDIDKAIEQLRYAATPSEMEYIEEAETAEKKTERFLEFWQKRDPDPQTPRNELMEEYYDRVVYANKNFGAYIEGWKSDMGMVFIRYGAPENIDRHPFDTDSKPYEIWYYYQLNRKFIFEDLTGFGDYRLVYPTTDLWGRIRN
jgi:GWxTD domain-containing protein